MIMHWTQDTNVEEIFLTKSDNSLWKYLLMSGKQYDSSKLKAFLFNNLYICMDKMLRILVHVWFVEENTFPYLLVHFSPFIEEWIIIILYFICLYVNIECSLLSVNCVLIKSIKMMYIYVFQFLALVLLWQQNLKCSLLI